MKPSSSSIQIKLIRLILTICGLVLLVACGSFLLYEYFTFRNIAKRELNTLGQVTAYNLTSSLAFDDRDDATDLLQALRSQKDIVAAAVFDSSGNLFATYPKKISPHLLPATIKDQGYFFASNFLEGYEPVLMNTKRLGTLYLKSDLRPAFSRLRLYGGIASLFFLLVFLLTYLLSRKLQRSITRPILHLAGKARLVSEKKDYSVRAETKSDDELGTLTDAFNQMLTQIESQNREIQALNSNLEEKIDRRTAELQQANGALKEQNELIQTIIDSSIDVIAVLDKELTILTLNKYAADFLQHSSENLIGKRLLQVVPELAGKTFVANLQQALNGEFIHVEAYHVQLADAFFENFFIPLRDQEGDVDRVLLIAHDVTGIMRANAKLQLLNAELEKSNHDLEQFAYVASHDLQEPLRKITTYADLCEHKIDNPELRTRYLQKIASSARRMTDLIKAVLNYSRLSRTDAEFTEVDLNFIIDQLETDLELTITERNAVINKEVLPAVRGIPLQISQLFLNLLTNALKFTEKAPLITIGARPLTSEDRQITNLLKGDSGYLKIEFSDNGIGFDQTYADKIFYIFQRLHTGDQFGGTGIGLALCKKIVENHQGAITVKSEKGKGTSFFIYFPIDTRLQETTGAILDRTINTTDTNIVT
ncbi:MAG TPA: ATP-binding protein [Flavisolibacter sp.]|nr:ATP-binding protein [Flavisolibacter sp.]